MDDAGRTDVNEWNEMKEWNEWMNEWKKSFISSPDMVENFYNSTWFRKTCKSRPDRCQIASKNDGFIAWHLSEGWNI